MLNKNKNYFCTVDVYMKYVYRKKKVQFWHVGRWDKTIEEQSPDRRITQW
jgi:hypothetical protein